MFGTLPTHFVYAAWEREKEACQGRQRSFEWHTINQLEKFQSQSPVAEALRSLGNAQPSVMRQPRLAWLADVDGDHGNDENEGMLMPAVVDMLQKRSFSYSVPVDFIYQDQF